MFYPNHVHLLLPPPQIVISLKRLKSKLNRSHQIKPIYNIPLLAPLFQLSNHIIIGPIPSNSHAGLSVVFHSLDRDQPIYSFGF